LTPIVPAGVLGEAWRGGPHHHLSRLLKGCEVEDLTEVQAGQVGVLAARSGLSDTVDLAVVEGALRLQPLPLPLQLLPRRQRISAV
jgi:hypothetical protein